MMFEHLNISDDLVKIKRVNEYVIYTITASDEYDAEYLVGLKKLQENTGIPLCINGRYCNIVSAKRNGNNVTLVCKELSGKYIITSQNILISNSFVNDTTKVPSIIVPSGTKVLYNGLTPKNEGLIDIYEVSKVELVEAIPLTLIKVYDNMNSSDESQWKLVSDTENHKFVGDWIIEYANIRWRSDGSVYIWNGSEWVKTGIISLRFNFDGTLMYLSDTNQKNQLFRIKENKMEINAEFCRNNLHHYAYKYIEFIFENGYVRYDGDDGTESVYYGGFPDLVSGIILVNSDYKVKTFSHESDYTLDSGNNGWVMVYWMNSDIPVICYSKDSNVSYSKKDGDCMASNFYSVPLVNYKGKIFNEAEKGTIKGGSSSSDSGASGGNVVQGNGATLNVVIFETNTVPANWTIPAGDYKVIFRVKASGTSTNDSIKFEVYNNTTSTSVASVTKTGGDIGTSYTYVSLDLTGYNGTDSISIRVTPGANKDGTTFSVDYAIIVPVSEIQEIQKRVFVINNQKLTVVSE